MAGSAAPYDMNGFKLVIHSTCGFCYYQNWSVSPVTPSDNCPICAFVFLSWERFLYFLPVSGHTSLSLWHTYLCFYLSNKHCTSPTRCISVILYLNILFLINFCSFTPLPLLNPLIYAYLFNLIRGLLGLEIVLSLCEKIVGRGNVMVAMQEI